MAVNTADLIIKNASIYTMNSQDQTASAMAVKGDTILAVGTEDEIRAFAGEETKTMDLQGKMVVPGFLSGHDHIAAYEKHKRVSVMLGDTAEKHSVELYTRMIKDYINDHPEMDVIIGQGMDLKVFPGGNADNIWLEESFPGKAIVLFDESGHGMLLSSKAMEMAGIDENTPAPDGGTIYRNNDGKMTGYFSDARCLIEETIPTADGLLRDFDPEDPLSNQIYMDAYEEFQTLANSYGLTGMSDGGEGCEGVWHFFDEYSKTGKMSMRLNLPHPTNDDPLMGQLDGIIKALDDGKAKYESDYLHINQVKHIIDGVPEGKTALLMEPYEAEAEMGDDYYGQRYATQEELDEFVAALDKAGYQVMIHSMGDGGCHACVESFSKAIDANGTKDPRHTIVHASLMTDEDIEKAGKYGIYAATQPIWFYVDPQFSELEIQMIGKERFLREYRARYMQRVGMTITGGADYPVTPDFSPLSGIICGATQGSPYEEECGKEEFIRNTDQTLSVYDMIKVYTINCAKQMFMEDIIGSLEPGKKADLVVLDRDITKAPLEELPQTKICYTIFGGRIVYEG